MEKHPQRDTSWSSFRTRNVEAILGAAGMEKKMSPAKERMLSAALI